MIWKEKQKGNDFHGFIKNCAQSMLEANRIGVYSATIRGAVSETRTSHNDRKLFFQVVGDLKEEVRVSGVSLCIGINVTGVTVADQGRERGEIDTEPVILSGK